MQSYQEFSQRIDAVLNSSSVHKAILSGGSEYNWGELYRAVADFEALFQQLELPVGSAVGVITHSSPNAVAALLALLKTGRCFATINPIQSSEKIASDITKLRLPAVILAENDLDNDIINRAVYSTGGAVLVTSSTPDLSVKLSVKLLQKKQAGEYYPLQKNIAVLMQSSGTTGDPKRIPLTFKSLLFPISQQLRKEESEVVYKATPLIVASPLAHIGGLFFAVKAVLDARPQVLMERFNVQQWVDLVKTHQMKLGHLVPATIKMIFDADVAREDLASLKALISGSAPLRPELQQAFEARYGTPILVVYGATEFAGGVAGWTLPLYNEFLSSKLGSVGRAMPGTDLRIVSEADGSELAADQEGLLQIRSKQSPTGSFDWVQTSDLAVIDNEQFLWIRGRADAAINRGGFKIVPTEVESVLMQYPGVSEVVVVGIDDDRLGEVPVAAVIAKPGIALDSDALQDFSRGHLAKYQVPARILIVESVPRTASMKPSLPAVKTLFANTKVLTPINSTLKSRE